MRTIPVLGVAFEALRRNVLRSALTSLGIIIGVAAVIVMMALGDGARQSITRIQSLGTNVITVMAGSFSMGPAQKGSGAIRRHRGGRSRHPGRGARREGCVAGAELSGQVVRRRAPTQIKASARRSRRGHGRSRWDVLRRERGGACRQGGRPRAIVRDQLFGENTDPTAKWCGSRINRFG
jgi:hypothetical protein